MTPDEIKNFDAAIDLSDEIVSNTLDFLMAEMNLNMSQIKTPSYKLRILTIVIVKLFVNHIYNLSEGIGKSLLECFESLNMESFFKDKKG